MATRSSILAWKIPWTEEPGGQQSTGSQRHDWRDLARMHAKEHAKWYHKRFNQQNPDWETTGQMTLFLQQLNCKEKRKRWIKRDLRYYTCQIVYLPVQFVDLLGSWLKEWKTRPLGKQENLTGCLVILRIFAVIFRCENGMVTFWKGALLEMHIEYLKVKWYSVCLKNVVSCNWVVSGSKVENSFDRELIIVEPGWWLLGDSL